MASTGAGRPVQMATCRAAWLISIPRPLAVAAPRLRAARQQRRRGRGVDQVGNELTAAQHRGVQGERQSVARGHPHWVWR